MKHKPIKYTKAEYGHDAATNSTVLLNVEPLTKETCPFVQLETVLETQLTKQEFELLWLCWTSIQYPKDSLAWLINDSSGQNEEYFDNLEDERILYNQEREACGDDVVVVFCPGHYYYPSHVVSKVQCLMREQKQFVFSHPIGGLQSDMSSVVYRSRTKSPFYNPSVAYFYDKRHSSEKDLLSKKGRKKGINLPFFFNVVAFLKVDENNYSTTGDRDITDSILPQALELR